MWKCIDCFNHDPFHCCEFQFKKKSNGKFTYEVLSALQLCPHHQKLYKQFLIEKVKQELSDGIKALEDHRKNINFSCTIGSPITSSPSPWEVARRLQQLAPTETSDSFFDECPQMSCGCDIKVKGGSDNFYYGLQAESVHMCHEHSIAWWESENIAPIRERLKRLVEEPAATIVSGFPLGESIDLAVRWFDSLSM